MGSVKTVLFAWELGRGLGHLMTIRRAASRLRPHGIRIAAAVKSGAETLQPHVDEVIGAPPWPTTGRAAASSTTLNDILSEAGLADGAVVQRLLAGWDAVLSEHRPDLVVAEFAPMASLAARNRVPLLLIGNGYTLPPHDMRRFPTLHRHSPPLWSEPRTLDTVNAAVRALGREPLERLPQLFQGDAHQVQTFPLLDPYDTQRPELADGPIFDVTPEARRTDASDVFVYLSAGYQPHPDVLAALTPVARRLRVHAPAIPPSWQHALSAAGARIEPQPPRLSDALASARLVVHHGGSGVAAEALASGVPQIILSAQIEQDLTGLALERAGVARLVRTYEAGATIAPSLLSDAADDPPLAQRATALGEWHRAYAASKDTLQAFEQTCLLLLAS